MERKRSKGVTIFGWLEIAIGAILSAFCLFVLLFAPQNTHGYGYAAMFSLLFLPVGFWALIAGYLLLKSRLSGKIMSIIFFILALFVITGTLIPIMFQLIARR